MSLGRDSLSYWTSQVFTFAFSFVTSVFVAVILGVDGRGAFTGVILANTTLVNLTNLGLQVSAAYFVGKRREELARFHTIILIVALGVTAVDLIGVAIFGDLLRRSIFEDVPWSLLIAGLAALPFSLYYFAGQGVLTGLGRVKDLSRFLLYYTTTVNAANLIALGLLPDRMRVGALLAIWAASQILAAGTLFAMIRREGIGWGWGKFADLRRSASEFLGYGLRAFVGNFATTVINRVDHWYVLATAGVGGLGLYGLAAKLAELIYQPSAALETAAYRRVVTADRSEAARLIQDIFRMNFLINGAVMLALALIAKPLVLLFYREEYAGSILPLRVLLPGALLLSCSRVFALFFSAQLGKPQIPSAIAWATLAFHLPLMQWVVMVQGRGLPGAAVVTTSSYGLMLLIYLGLFAKTTGLFNPADYFIPKRRDFERIGRLVSEVLSSRRSPK